MWVGLRFFSRIRPDGRCKAHDFVAFLLVLYYLSRVDDFLGDVRAADRPLGRGGDTAVAVPLELGLPDAFAPWATEASRARAEAGRGGGEFLPHDFRRRQIWRSAGLAVLPGDGRCWGAGRRFLRGPYPDGLEIAGACHLRIAHPDAHGACVLRGNSSRRPEINRRFWGSGHCTRSNINIYGEAPLSGF